MPLRDHFRPPLDDVHSWDELHGGWPMTIVQELVEVLPEPYFAAPGVHLGTLYAPPKPTLTLEPRLPNQDVYEVRVYEVNTGTYQTPLAAADKLDLTIGGATVATYDSRPNRRLVAAIEIISPSNKDRPENRATLVAKVATLLKNNICVSIVDVVSTFDFNLYAELMSFLNGVDSALGSEPSPTYAATLRMRHEDRAA